jgi:PAB1-binding protein PBP1
MTKDQLEKAERIAKEIEGQQSSNIHMQEERGHALEREIDEEDLYSGVLRQSNEKESVWKRGVPQKVNTPSPKQGQPNKTKTANSGKVENNTSGKTKKIDGANTPPPGLDITTKEVNIVQPDSTPSQSLAQEVANMEINEDNMEIDIDQMNLALREALERASYT